MPSCKRPANPARQSRKLRGTIPVTVSARRPNPLIVPLEKSAGKTFENSDIQLTVHDIRTLARLAANLGRAIDQGPIGPMRRPAADTDGYSSIFQRGPARPASNRRARRERPSHAAGSNRSPTPRTPTLPHADQPDPDGPPKELRYYSVTRTDVDIPFEFSDIPMP